MTMDIRINVENEADLYNGFDAEGLRLSDEFMSFLHEKGKRLPKGETADLIIVSNTKLDEERLKAAFEAEAELGLEDNETTRKRNRIRQLYFLAIGMFFIGAGIAFTDRILDVYTEVLSIVGWVAVWEAANIWIIENPTSRHNTRRIEFLRKSSITFEYTTQA